MWHLPLFFNEYRGKVSSCPSGVGTLRMVAGLVNTTNMVNPTSLFGLALVGISIKAQTARGNLPQQLPCRGPEVLSTQHHVNPGKLNWTGCDLPITVPTIAPCVHYVTFTLWHVLQHYLAEMHIIHVNFTFTLDWLLKVAPQAGGL